MLSKTFVLVASATSAYAACSLSPGAGAVQLAANSIYSPDPTDSRTPVKGVPFNIIYDGTGLGATLDFVLLKGPSTNIIPQGYIATGVKNCGTASCTLSWTPDCSLADTAGAYNGYGIRMDDETTCKYQYTQQFGLKAGTTCGAQPSASSSAAPSGRPSSVSSVAPPPPTGTSRPPTSSGVPAPSFVTSCYPAPSGNPAPKPSGGSSPPSPPSGGYVPPSNGTSYQPPNVSGGSTKPTYTPVQSNDASGRFAINAISAVVALAASVMLL